MLLLLQIRLAIVQPDIIFYVLFFLSDHHQSGVVLPMESQDPGNTLVKYSCTMQN